MRDSIQRKPLFPEGARSVSKEVLFENGGNFPRTELSAFEVCIHVFFSSRAAKYSKIPILRPPLGLSKSGLKDHFWTVPKVVSNQRYTL